MYKKLITALFVLFVVTGCGAFEKSKNFVKDNAPGGNPLKEASNKDALIQARSEVVSSKKAYNSCMENNDQDVYRCESERERYDAATNRYMELQQSAE